MLLWPLEHILIRLGGERKKNYLECFGLLIFLIHVGEKIGDGVISSVIKPDPSMNKKILSNKSVLLIATMLSTMMLATSSMASLVPTTAFAQDDARQEDSRDVEVAEGDVEVDPILQTEVQADVNTNVDTAVVTDEEDCDEATNDETQQISQSSDQLANRDVETGEDSLYVNPIVQTSVQAAFNYNVDTDVVLVEGCQPVDNVTTETSQSSNQQANRDIEAGEGSDLELPTYQRQVTIGQNHQINEDVYAPLPE
jgi:hypothetical protein